MPTDKHQQDDEQTKAVKGIRDLLLLIVIVALVCGVIWLFAAAS